jgi:cytochrome c oxidase assembly protein subunit 15
MPDTVALVDMAPTLRLMLLALVVAMLPLSWVWLQQRGRDTSARIAALTAVTLFLTFDLIVFGAFTRLTDSGLGCPDWPGCYGSVSPLGASDEIRAAQTVAPTGPVTFTKAWIEMIHRYLAMSVGVLILVMAVTSWLGRRDGSRLPHSPWWPTVTLVWVVIQGLFGKYTVTLKLYPAVVTLHLLGGMLLLALLTVQHETWRGRVLLWRSRCCCGCRSRSVAGCRRTMRCWRAGAFRSATVSGGRPWISPRVSRCCASWVDRRRAGFCRWRRSWPSTWRIA